MSAEKHEDAILQGISPVYPEAVDGLNRAYDAAGCVNGQVLEEVARPIKGFFKMTRETTDDGYDWFWNLKFRRGRGIVNVAFPWAQDWKKCDDLQNDRSIAVYTKGKVSDEQVDDLIGDIVSGLEGYVTTPISA